MPFPPQEQGNVVLKNLIHENERYQLFNHCFLCSNAVNLKSVGFADFSLGVFQALWAYDGFDNILYITEEVKKPRKTLPAIIIVSVLFVMALYLLVNLSYFSGKSDLLRIALHV